MTHTGGLTPNHPVDACLATRHDEKLTHRTHWHAALYLHKILVSLPITTRNGVTRFPATRACTKKCAWRVFRRVCPGQRSCTAVLPSVQRSTTLISIPSPPMTSEMCRDWWLTPASSETGEKLSPRSTMLVAHRRCGMNSALWDAFSGLLSPQHRSARHKSPPIGCQSTLSPMPPPLWPRP